MKKPYIKYLAALIMFGSNGIIAKQIALGSYEIVLTRTLIGSVFLVLIFLLTKQKVTSLKNRTHVILVVCSGAAMGISWMFLYEAYAQMGVSIASLAYYCGPVLVMMLSPVLFREKLTWVKISGFLAVIIGMLLVNQSALMGGKASWGLVFGVLSAVMYAFMVVLNKKAASVTGLENSVIQLIASFMTVAVFVGLKEGFNISIEPGSVLPILVLGVINTGLGCYLYFSSIGKLPVQTVAVCGYLEPLSALIFSAVFLMEKLELIQISGAVLILGGAAFGAFPRKAMNNEK
ncbi:MAG: EamA family transporter [Clostridiales bacterium]|nr:EamA family transporter [Clostridiales bacterium]